MSEKLTDRECEILERIANGQTTREVAFDLGIEINTVYCHLKHAYRKLEVSNRIMALRMAARLGLIKERP